jgi:transcriptional regulator with XRE-family HTH domain
VNAKLLNIVRVEALIDEKGWKKPYFCSLFGKERGWISDWKRGRGLPDDNTLAEIAYRLGTTVEYLTDQTDDKKRPAAQSDGPSENAIKFIHILRERGIDFSVLTEADIDKAATIFKLVKDQGE